MKVEFGEWLPDLAPLDNPGCLEAKNVIARASGFSPLRAPTTFSAALTQACIGAAWMSDLAGNAVNFAGGTTRLYKYVSASASWADVSRTATYAAAVSWNFEKYGNRAIAVDVANAPQYYDMANSSTFQNLGGSPPQARYVATVRDFLVLANLSGLPQRVQWSGFNNSELWTSSLATQSDYQDLLGSGGDIQGIVPGEYGVIFQESSIWRMDYVGPPVIFNLDEVERGRGTPSPKSIVYYGSNVFFYDWSGFHVFNGQGSAPIGHERVDAWFDQNCGDVQSIQGVADRQNRLILWGFKASSSDPYNNRILIYNYGVNRWSWGEVTTQYMSERRAPALTLDQLDTPLPDGIDLDSIFMDSRAFSSDINVQAFDVNNRAFTFDGTAMPATVETRELSFDEHRADTNAVMPLVDGEASVRVRFVQRNTQAATATYSNAIGLNRVGEACKVQTGRYQRFRLEITGGYDFIRGVDIRTRQTGRR